MPVTEAIQPQHMCRGLPKDASCCRRATHYSHKTKQPLRERQGFNPIPGTNQGNQGRQSRAVSQVDMDTATEATPSSFHYQLNASTSDHETIVDQPSPSLSDTSTQYPLKAIEELETCEGDLQEILQRYYIDDPNAYFSRYKTYKEGDPRLNIGVAIYGDHILEGQKNAAIAAMWEFCEDKGLPRHRVVIEFHNVDE